MRGGGRGGTGGGVSWWAYVPRPFPRELAGEDPRRARMRDDARLGVDAQGRVVFRILRDDLFQLYDWASECCDMIEFNGAVSKLERLLFVDGRLAEEITIDGGKVRLDGRPAVTVTRWRVARPGGDLRVGLAPQLDRNAEAAHLVAASLRKRSVVIVCHEHPLKHHEQALLDGYRAGTWSAGWPHLDETLRRRLGAAMGTVTWKRLADAWPSLAALLL